MSGPDRFDGIVFFRVIAGVAFGAVASAALLLWAVPAMPQADYRPAVLSTVLVPLGCFLAWLWSGSRERAGTAAVASFALYFLSAFAAARLRTLPAMSLGAWTWDPGAWSYFWLVVIVQAVGGLAIAAVLGSLGRGLTEVERLKGAGDVPGLVTLLLNGNARQRREAARALGSLTAEPGVRPALLQALEDADVAVVREALGALVGLAVAEDRPRLEALLGHADPAVRRRARRALGWIGEK